MRSQTPGGLPVSEWTDINTYVPTGLGFEKG